MKMKKLVVNWFFFTLLACLVLGSSSGSSVAILSDQRSEGILAHSCHDVNQFRCGCLETGPFY